MIPSFHFCYLSGRSFLLTLTLTTLSLFSLSLFYPNLAPNVYAQSTGDEPLLGAALTVDENNPPADNAGVRFDNCGGEVVAATNFEFEQMVVQLTNEERATNGLPPMKLQKELSDAARYHSVDMFQDDYFEHDSYDREGGNLVFICSTWDRIQVYYPSPRAENIAWNYRTPESVVQAWIDSPGHYRNIMGAYREIGVGLHQWYWNQDFGTRNESYPTIINGEAIRTDNAQVSIYTYGAWQEMRLRNDSGAWTNWLPFQNQIVWTINATPGLRTVGIEVRNGATTHSTSDAIEYTGPAGPAPTSVPPTLVPTDMPPTLVPTEVPPTPVPPTLVPTEVPPTPVPPTLVPTEVPPTLVPTDMPPTLVPTEAPPTATPIQKPPVTNTSVPAPTEVPPTGIPPTEVAPTSTVDPATPVQKPTVTSTALPVPVTPDNMPTIMPTGTVTGTVTPVNPGATATPTAPVPASVSLRGRVRLEGRPQAPNAQWVTALKVDLHDPFTGDQLYSYPVTTDEQGIFVVNDIVPGVYQVGIKTSHSLQTGSRVNLQFGDAEVDFDLLKEGDANDDNAINIWDFAMWRRSKNTCVGESGFNANTDFDQNGCTNLVDGQMLFANFGSRGSLDSSGTGRGNDDREANIQPLMTIRDKIMGERFTVSIELATILGGQPQLKADSSAIHLRYLPDTLRAISITGHPSFETILEDRINNGLGHVDFAAATEGEPVQLTGAIATVVFEAVRDIQVNASGRLDGTTIEIIRSGPDVSDIALDGISLLQGGTPGEMVIFAGKEESIGPVEVTDVLFLPLTVQ